MKNTEHKHIIVKNKKDETLNIFYSKHYGEEWYTITKINGVDVNFGVCFETLENAIKKTE